MCRTRYGTEGRGGAGRKSRITAVVFLLPCERSQRGGSSHSRLRLDDALTGPQIAESMRRRKNRLLPSVWVPHNILTCPVFVANLRFFGLRRRPSLLRRAIAHMAPN